MGFNVQFSNNPEIVVCGSILGINYITINTRIWGTGLHHDDELPSVKNMNLIYAVRGKLTLKNLNLSSSCIPIGDPGLLLSRFHKPKKRRIYDICIISHYIDYKYFINNYGNRYYIINMATNNIKKIANSISKCNFIFSSSLHGLIFSHSLGIPAVHLEYHLLASKNNYKFKDYYSVLNIPYNKEDLKKENLENIIERYRNKNKRHKYLPNVSIIKQIQDNLLFTFPYQKMTNVICTYVNQFNESINEWCKYHLNLGFDNIYIFNNINNASEYIGDYLDFKIKKRVHILNINNNQREKIYFYNAFYTLFKNNFKWCAFIDITDSIVSVKRNYLTSLFEHCSSKNISVIKLQSYEYKFNKLFQKPIKEKNEIIGNQSKYIVKGSLIGSIGNIFNLSTYNITIYSKLKWKK